MRTVNVDAISPEEQIRRVARGFLAMSHPPAPGVPRPSRPDLRGLIDMIERHLDGDLPPIEVGPDEPRSAES